MEVLVMVEILMSCLGSHETRTDACCIKALTLSSIVQNNI